MKFAHKVAHLLFPRESNNQKAKLLHSSSLTVITFALVLFQIILNFLPAIQPRILGYAANISPTEVIRLTNEKRAQAGLSSLQENSTLSQAAQAKGADMLNKGYWAHISPDGITPWKFFTDVGYRYRYAGENLARDFSNPSSAVDAWMASPSHKENLLSAKYKEIGIAVVEGKLAGVETTIIVQLFGTKYADSIPLVPVAKAKSVNETLATTPVQEPTPSSLPEVSLGAGTLASPPKEELLSNRSQVLVSPFNTTKGISLVIIALLLVILVIDGIITSRRKVARISGRTFAHIAFLGMILAIVLILKAGQII